jgi:hypothetical protein
LIAVNGLAHAQAGGVVGVDQHRRGYRGTLRLSEIQVISPPIRRNLENQRDSEKR